MAIKAFMPTVPFKWEKRKGIDGVVGLPFRIFFSLVCHMVWTCTPFALSKATFHFNGWKREVRKLWPRCCFLWDGTENSASMHQQSKTLPKSLLYYLFLTQHIIFYPPPPLPPPRDTATYPHPPPIFNNNNNNRQNTQTKTEKDITLKDDSSP